MLVLCEKGTTNVVDDKKIKRSSIGYSLISFRALVVRPPIVKTNSITNNVLLAIVNDWFIVAAPNTFDAGIKLPSSQITQFLWQSARSGNAPYRAICTPLAINPP